MSATDEQRENYRQLSNVRSALEGSEERQRGLKDYYNTILLPEVRRVSNGGYHATAFAWQSYDNLRQVLPELSENDLLDPKKLLALHISRDMSKNLISKIGDEHYATAQLQRAAQIEARRVYLEEHGLKYNQVTSLRPIGSGTVVNPFVLEGSAEEGIQRTWSYENLKTLNARIVSMVDFTPQPSDSALESLNYYRLRPQYDNGYDNGYDKILTVALRKPKICASLITARNPYTIGYSGFIYKVPTKNIFVMRDSDFQSRDIGNSINQHIIENKYIQRTPQEIIEVGSTGILRNGLLHNELNLVPVMGEEEISITGVILDDLKMLNTLPVNQYCRDLVVEHFKCAIEIAQKYDFPIYTTSMVQRRGWESISLDQALCLVQQASLREYRRR